MRARGQDRDKWIPEGRKERIETGAISQTFIHIPQNWHSSWWRHIRWCGQMYEHRLTDLQSLHKCTLSRNNTTYSTNTLAHTYTDYSCKDRAISVSLGSFVLSNGEERQVTQESKPSGQQFLPYFFAHLTLSASHQTSTSCSSLSLLTLLLKNKTGFPIANLIKKAKTKNTLILLSVAYSSVPYTSTAVSKTILKSISGPHCCWHCSWFEVNPTYTIMVLEILTISLGNDC